MLEPLTVLTGASCVVTGGAGAIGSNLVRALSAHGCRVTVLDNLSSGYAENLHGVPNVALQTGDVCNDDDVSAALAAGPAYVFHLAAQFANQNSVDHPVTDLLTNALGTLRLLEACRYAGGLRRFVYASSSCVLSGQEGILTESSPPQPDTPYAISKLAGEFYTRAYHELYGLPTSVVRYFNVYGPGERPGPYRNVLPNFIDRALGGQPLVITGTGDETREFVYVEDAVRATLLAAVHEAAVGELFHVGSGAVLKIRDVARQVLEATNSLAPLQYAPRRGWDSVLSRQTAFDKARRLLGYEPRVSFADGLGRTVAWLRQVSASDGVSADVRLE